MERQGLNLGESVLAFLTSLPAEESKDKQQEINRFVQWYGKDRPVGKITPLEIENYAEWVAKSTGDVSKKLEPVRSFLTYAKKEKLVKTTLATHLRTKKTATRSHLRSRPKQEVTLTPEDHAKLKARLATLEEERVQIAEELRRAAADKDFRENAPLQAAREQRDQIEAKIREIQAAISTGVLVQIEEQAEEVIVRLGSKVTVCEVASGVKVTYTLVTKNEANPGKNRISMVSPIGKALLNRCQGDVVKVIAPAGELKYQIENIE
jgi:transcription elongation factor GreA